MRYSKKKDPQDSIEISLRPATYWQIIIESENSRNITLTISL